VCTVTFAETGLPSGTSWGVTFNGSFYSSSTPVIKVGGVVTYAYWSTTGLIASGTPGVAWGTTSTYGYVSVPSQTHVTIPFVQEYWVAVVTNPTYSGSAGISGMGASGYFPAGATLPLLAVGNDYAAFHGWSSSAKSLKLASAKAATTTVTLGASGTITATFVSPMTTLTFTEFNLPTGTTWGIGVYLGAWTVVYSSSSTLTIHNVPATYSTSWNVVSPLAGTSAGVQFAAVNPGGSLNPVYENAMPVVFQEQFQVTVQTGGVTGGSVSPSGSAYFANGTVLAIDAVNATAANFTSWSSSTASISLASSGHAATTITILGTGTVTAKFH
jgi:hypothetical protein